MRKQGAQGFSLSEPVHWISHTKHLLLEKEQTARALHTLAVRTALPGTSGVAPRHESPGPYQGTVAEVAVELMSSGRSLRSTLAHYNQGMSLIKTPFFSSFLTPELLNYWLFSGHGQSGRHMKNESDTQRASQRGIPSQNWFYSQSPDP